MPGDRFIFFPLLNALTSEEGTATRARLTTFVGNTTELHASLDGVVIPELELFCHRELSPVFDIPLGWDNIFGAPAGVYTPSVCDGSWRMLEPLGPGTHTINFGGTSQGDTDPTFGGYSCREKASEVTSLYRQRVTLLSNCRRRAPIGRVYHWCATRAKLLLTPWTPKPTMVRAAFDTLTTCERTCFRGQGLTSDCVASPWSLL